MKKKKKKQNKYVIVNNSRYIWVYPWVALWPRTLAWGGRESSWARSRCASCRCPDAGGARRWAAFACGSSSRRLSCAWAWRTRARPCWPSSANACTRTPLSPDRHRSDARTRWASRCRASELRLACKLLVILWNCFEILVNKNNNNNVFFSLLSICIYSLKLSTQK